MRFGLSSYTICQMRSEMNGARPGKNIVIAERILANGICLQSLPADLRNRSSDTAITMMAPTNTPCQ
jgi:hypothetical protein